MRHERLHDVTRRFKCDECFKRFKSRDHLMIHVRTHTGEKPYECDVCGRRFSQDQSMRHHVKFVH